MSSDILFVGVIGRVFIFKAFTKVGVNREILEYIRELTALSILVRVAISLYGLSDLIIGYI